MDASASSFHLTPRKLVGRRFPPDVFGGIRVALVGYCPPPPVFGRYETERMRDQHFIHVAPDSVRIVSHGGSKFLSLAHVYGGPVSAATVEELAYYGFEYVLAYGLAGGLGTGGLGMGSVYVVESALAMDGTTRHYVASPVITADADLLRRTAESWSATASEPLHAVRAATGDAIYREDDAMLQGFREGGCHVVNLDTAHLYAASKVNSENRHLKAIQCGVVSDVIHPDGRSESQLATMLATGHATSGPLDRVSEIVRFYIEKLGPTLPPNQP